MKSLSIFFLLIIILLPAMGKEPIQESSQVRIQEGDRPVFIKIPLEKFVVEVHPFKSYNNQEDLNLHKGDENFFSKFIVKILGTVDNPKVIFTQKTDGEHREGQKLFVDGNFAALASGEYLLDICLYDPVTATYINGWVYRAKNWRELHQENKENKEKPVLDKIAGEIAMEVTRKMGLYTLNNLKNKYSSFKFDLKANCSDKNPRSPFTVTMTSDKDCYVTLLNLSSDGNLSILLPNNYSKNKIFSGKVLKLPGADKSEAPLFQMSHVFGNGKNVIVAIASKEPIELATFSGEGDILKQIKFISNLFKELEKINAKNWAVATTEWDVQLQNNIQLQNDFKKSK